MNKHDIMDEALKAYARKREELAEYPDTIHTEGERLQFLYGLEYGINDMVMRLTGEPYDVRAAYMDMRGW